MATLYSAQLQKSQDEGNQFNSGLTEVGAKERISFFKRLTTDATNGNVANGDTIDLVRVPKNARILGGQVLTTALGASVTLSLGTNEALTNQLDATLSASATNLLAATSVAAATNTAFAATAALGAGAITTAETTIYATIGGASPAADQVIYGWVRYVQN